MLGLKGPSVPAGVWALPSMHWEPLQFILAILTPQRIVRPLEAGSRVQTLQQCHKLDGDKRTTRPALGLP